MAIVDNKTGEVTFSGRVLSVDTRCERVMSDIYADVTRATVILEDGSKQVRAIRYHFECDLSDRSATVDITPEWAELASAKTTLNFLTETRERLERNVDEIIREARQKAHRTLAKVVKGDEVRISRKSAKNPRGTVGVVFWVGTCNFSGKERFGIKTPEGATHWVADASCQKTSVDKSMIVRAQDAAEKAVRVDIAARLVTLENDIVDADFDYERALRAVN